MLGAPSHGWGTFQGVSEELFVDEHPWRPISKTQAIAADMNSRLTNQFFAAASRLKGSPFAVEI